jgi:hypothetical protein
MTGFVNILIEQPKWACDLNSVSSIELATYDTQHHLNIYSTVIRDNDHESGRVCVCLSPDKALELRDHLNELYPAHLVRTQPLKVGDKVNWLLSDRIYTIKHIIDDDAWIMYITDCGGHIQYIAPLSNLTRAQ